MIPIMKSMSAIKSPEFLSLVGFKELHDSQFGIGLFLGLQGFQSIVNQPTLSQQPYVPIVGIRVLTSGELQIGIGSSKQALVYSRTGPDYLVAGQDGSLYEVKITQNSITSFAGTLTTSPSAVGSFLALTEDREWEFKRSSSSGIGRSILNFDFEIREIADTTNKVVETGLLAHCWILL